MSTKNFLSDANVQMLWEVLIDEDTIMGLKVEAEGIMEKRQAERVKHQLDKQKKVSLSMEEENA